MTPCIVKKVSRVLTDRFPCGKIAAQRCLSLSKGRAPERLLWTACGRTAAMDFTL